MSRKSAFPVPPPLPGTKKAFPEVQGRALPSSVRKFLAKPASRPALALSVKPTATEARPTSPLAVKPQHHDHLQHASALLRKQDEDKVFRSKISVRIIAITTGRSEHQDNVIRTCDEAQHHPVAKKSLVDSVPKTFRARPSAPNSKIPSFVPVCGKGKQAVTTLQVQPQVGHFQAAGFVSRIPVRKLNGQAESPNFQRTMPSVILPPQSSTVPATVKTDLIPEITVIREEDCRDILPQGDSLVALQQEPCSGDEQPGQEQSIVLDCIVEQREDVSDVHIVPLLTEPSVNEVTDAQLVQSHDAGESVVLADPQLESAAVPPLTRKQKKNFALSERRKRNKRAAKLLVSEVPSSSTLVDAILADDQELVPPVPHPESECWGEMIPQGDSLVGVQQEPCSGDELPGQEQSIVLDCMEDQREDVSDVPTVSLQTEPSVNEVTDAPSVQLQDNESMVSANPQLESAAVPPLTRKQKKNFALSERRKGKKRAAKLLVSEVPSSSTIVNAIFADNQESVIESVIPEPESPDSEETSIESQSVDAERIDLHTGKSQKTAKILKQLEEGHPPFLPYVFVMDCIRPYVPPPTYEVKTQPDDERLHVSNISLLVPSEEVVAYLEKLAGPVKYFSMYLNEDGIYNGKASVIFCSPSDARKALLLYNGTLMDGLKLKLKLFVNGERFYPNQVTLPPPSVAFQLDWVNAPACNRVIVPSLDCMMEFMSQHPANFIPRNF